MALDTRYVRIQTSKTSSGRYRFLCWLPVLLLGFCIFSTPRESFAQAAKPSAPGSDPAAIRQLAQDEIQQVFRSNEFWWKRTQEVDTADAPWLSQVINRLLKKLRDFLKQLNSVGFSGSTGDLSWLAGGLIGAGGLVLAWLVVRLLQHRRGQHPPASSQSVMPLEEELPSANKLWMAAQEAFGRGDHRTAVRLAFLAVLAALQDQGLVRYDPSRTNREYYRDLSTAPQIASRFIVVARPFERVWYGQRTIEKTELEQMLANCQNLLTPHKVQGELYP